MIVGGGEQVGGGGLLGSDRGGRSSNKNLISRHEIVFGFLKTIMVNRILRLLENFRAQGSKIT